jgi:hypothetical protein
MAAQENFEVNMSLENKQTQVSAGRSWFAHISPARIEFDIRPIRFADRRHESPVWGRKSVTYGQRDTQWLKKLNHPTRAVGRR